MPRKQRFKPSRKPKPVAQNEDAVMGKPPISATVRENSESPHEPPPVREDVPRTDVDSGAHSG